MRIVYRLLLIDTAKFLHIKVIAVVVDGFRSASIGRQSQRRIRGVELPVEKIVLERIVVGRRRIRRKLLTVQHGRRRELRLLVVDGGGKTGADMMLASTVIIFAVIAFVAVVITPGSL